MLQNHSFSNLFGSFGIDTSTSSTNKREIHVHLIQKASFDAGKECGDILNI